MIKFKKILLVVFSVIIIVILLLITKNNSRSLIMNSSVNGIVPNEDIAIKVAEIIGEPIFGKQLNYYKPLHARLENDSIWIVYGLPKKKILTKQIGGGPTFEIAKKDGRIIKVYIYR